MSRIYLDNAATTPLDPTVADAMMHVMQQHYGNPSSIHAEGRQARTLVEQARRTVAHHLRASIGDVFFTSGGTESSNMVLKGAVRDLGITRIISSPIEHHCVLHSLDYLKQHYPQVEIVLLPLSDTGHPDISVLEHLLQADDRPTLVSLMHANNEIGTRIDLQQFGQLCQQYGALFHSDTVQTIGFYPIDLSQLPVHFITGSAHKFHGPKGVGFVYINGSHQLKPFIDGGAQERNMRGGTENVYGVTGLAKALDLAYTHLPQREAHIRELRAYLLEELALHFPQVTFNGDVAQGHYKVLNLRFPLSPATELLLFNLDIAGISVSGGSACSSGTDTGSHVIRALRGDADDAVNLRVSFSHYNTQQDVASFLSALRGIVEK
ncbi:MAG: cysteine desulfurase family protein [Saprospiraceae bacterium]